MKAWLVRARNCEYATVVFADTRGKARAIAMHTDACEDAKFTDIEVYRKPRLDKYYTSGKKEMDWYNSKDRIALVKHCDFYCIEECDSDDCPALRYCAIGLARKKIRRNRDDRAG